MSSTSSPRPIRPEAPDTVPSSSPIRRVLSDALDPSNLPVEQRSLVMRLSEEVAALRRALDASHHRIAALEVEAAEDPLSGLLNRRAFLREIERAIAFQARYQMTCGVALIDVSGISALNAAQGHAFGNHCLRAIGESIRGGIRSCDIGARTGNEQFGTVLWNSAFSECAQRVGGLERAIGMLTLPTPIVSRSAVLMIEPGASPEALLAELDIELAGRPLRQ
jgi:diguanylate cyclase (GGDEF)-like protein